MSITLKKSLFKRNRSREKSIGDIFNHASKGLSSIMSFAITIFFTPALMATSLFSQEIVLMLINLSLCLGNLTNFFSRIYQNDIGKTELVTSLILLAVFIAGAYFLFPAVVSTTTFLGIITIANQIAVGINLFFLLRNSIVPPIMSWVKYIGKQLSFDNQDNYYQIKPLNPSKDACIVNALMLRHFKHGLYEGSVEADLGKLNQLLQILTGYINKYDEPLFGEINNKEAIQAIEDHIKQITLKGNADSSYSFVKQKIAFKKVKVHRLQEAQGDIEKQDTKNWQLFSTYFRGINETRYKSEYSAYHQQASDLFKKEIERQEEKINKLSECLP